MSEEVEFEPYGYGDSVSLKAKRWVRRGPKEYLFEFIFHYGRKEFCLQIAINNHDNLEFKGTSYERPSQSGDWDCFSKNYQDTLDCLEVKYGVKTVLVGITPEELARRARLAYEEAIAPAPREITMFDIVEGNSDKILEDMRSTLSRSCTISSVGKIGGDGEAYAKVKCEEILDHMIHDLSLWISNENWSEHYKNGRLKAEFKELIQKMYEYHSCRCEEVWEVAPKEPVRKDLSKGEKIAQAMFDELIKGPRRTAVQSLGDITARKLESERCKDALKSFLTTYSINMGRTIQQLR